MYMNVYTLVIYNLRYMYVNSVSIIDPLYLFIKCGKVWSTLFLFIVLIFVIFHCVILYKSDIFS